MQSVIITTILTIGIAAMVSSWPVLLSQSEFVIKNTTGLSTLEKDLAITSKQKRILDKFRKRVEHRLTHDFMKSDIYLIRWLRARSFNIPNAEEMLITSLAWRKENSIDTIQQEDWSDYEKIYRYYINILDKEGKPVAYMHPTLWDFRSIVVLEGPKRIQRYADKAMDAAWRKVYEFQTKYQNVTQGRILVNLDGYNTVQHGCPKCIPIILRAILTYEKNYPGVAQSIFVLNTPASFEPLLQTIKTALSPPTVEALRIYGMNKAEWKAVLFRYLDTDQIPVELGGTFPTDIEEDDRF